jgi:phosphoribosylanthranilate isomerase
LILSGGLSAGNVVEAVSVTRPYAVDSASGTESAPGHKDPRKLHDFFQAVALTQLQSAAIGQPA